MSKESKIALDCSDCNIAIYETLGWFQKPYATCPHWGKSH